MARGQRPSPAPRLRHIGIIKRINGSHRYYVTVGRAILTACCHITENIPFQLSYDKIFAEIVKSRPTRAYEPAEKRHVGHENAAAAVRAH
jgi:hypothetical protein